MKKIYKQSIIREKKHEKRWIIYFLLLASAFFLSLHFLSLLLIPKYTDVNREGGLISEYYAEVDAGNCHDVLFIGDCEIYSSIIPPVLWEKYSITSFVRASPGQTVEQSYYLLREMLEYELPDAVVLGVYGMCHENTERESYNRMTFDGMRMSRNKIDAVLNCKSEEESLVSYIFPVLRFHSRWKELGVEDIRYMFSRSLMSHNGYLMQKGVSGGEYSNGGEADAPLPEASFEILENMRIFCNERATELILVKMPTDSWRYPWYEEWSAQISKYAKEKGISYYDLLSDSENIGVDLSYDSYDGGLHLNVYGAEKVTEYLGNILDHYHVENKKRSPREICAWGEKLDNYYKERDGE